jgi:hypothetical protein
MNNVLGHESVTLPQRPCLRNGALRFTYVPGVSLIPQCWQHIVPGVAICFDNTLLPKCGQHSAETSRQEANLAVICVLTFRTLFSSATALERECRRNGRILLANPNQ